jgi:predicted nucleic acid-binding protein
MPATFLDASAIVKLVLHEPESQALIDFLDGQASVEASELSIAEVGRAVRRVDPGYDESEVTDVLVLHRVTPDVLRRAARLAPAGLRTLDAIHLATALSNGDGEVSVVTYDERMAAAARAQGLRVVQPGR